MTWLSRHRWATLGFAVSAAYIPGMLSAAFTPRWALIAVGVPLVSSLNPRRLPEIVRWMMVWMLTLAGISIIAATDQYAGVYYLIQMTILSLAFIAASELESIDDVMMGLGCGLALSSILCVPQFFGWTTGLIVGSAPPSGLFFNREVLGEFAALIFIWAALYKRWGMVLISGVPVVLTLSRVAVAAIAVAIIFRFWPKSWMIRIALLATVAIVSVASLLMLGEWKVGSAGLRLVIWGATIMAMTPLGNGLGWFGSAHYAEQFAHSDVLQLAAELGIGSIAVLLIPALVFTDKGHHVERSLFAAICFECLVSFPLHVPASAFLCVVVAGFMVGSRNRVRRYVNDGRDQDGVDREWRRTAGHPSFVRS